MAKKKERGLTPEELLKRALVPENEQLYMVPENWVWAYATAILNIEYGKGLSKKELKQEGYPVFGANGYIGFFEKYMFEDEQVLMSCRGAYSGVINTTVPFSYVTNNSLIISGKSKRMSYKFLAYLLGSIDRSNLISGSAQPQVTLQAFEGFSLPFPPLPEQQRIVDLIESLFEKLDQAKGLIQDAMDSFENRKAAILHKAFSGELTRKWREENGDEIWGNCVLGDVIVEKPRNGYSPVGVAYETKYKNLTLTATTSGVFRGEFFKYVDIDIEESSYLLLKKDDILIQRANSLEYVGACAIYDGNDNEYIYPDLMMKIRANSRVLTKYLYYALTSSSVKEYYRNNATGTAGNMPKINQTVVNNTPIILPPLQEQKEIVSILDDLFEKERTAKDLVNSIDAVDCMKESILARAFRGELGTNDPEEENAIEMLREALIQEGAEL